MQGDSYSNQKERTERFLKREIINAKSDYKKCIIPNGSERAAGQAPVSEDEHIDY